MSSTPSTNQIAERAPAASPALLVLAVVLGAGAATGLLAVLDPGMAMSVVILGILVLAVVRSPDLATFAVIFILYANIAVVASRFHGVPRIVASAFPLLLGAPLIRDLVLRRQRLIVTPALPVLLLLLVVQVLGMIFSRDPDVARTVVTEFIFEGLLLYFLITNAVRTPRSLRLAVWALLFAGFVAAIVPCYQQLTGTFDRNYGGFGQVSETGFRTGEITSRGEARQIRLAGTIGEQNRYAQNMLMILPLGLFLFLSERSRGLRTLVLVLAGVTGAGFLLSFSRGGAVGLVILIATMAILRIIAGRQLLVIGLLAAMGLAAVPQYWTRMKTMAGISSLFSEAGVRAGDLDSAIRRRITEMLAAGMVFADHPLIGVGPGMFKYYSEEYGNRLGIRRITGTRKAHSLYLEVAAEGGILGLVCFANVVLVTLYGLITARRHLARAPPGETPDAEHERLELANTVTGFLLALIAYLACALFLHLAYIRFFYAMLALAAASSGVARARAGSPPQQPPPVGPARQAGTA